MTIPNEKEFIKRLKNLAEKIEVMCINGDFVLYKVSSTGRVERLSQNMTAVLGANHQSTISQIEFTIQEQQDWGTAIYTPQYEQFPWNLINKRKLKTIFIKKHYDRILKLKQIETERKQKLMTDVPVITKIPFLVLCDAVRYQKLSNQIMEFLVNSAELTDSQKEILIEEAHWCVKWFDNISETLQKRLISKDKDVINQLKHPTEDARKYHNMLWRI